MAEEIQTTEVTKNLISNQGMLSNISNSLEKIKNFLMNLLSKDLSQL